MVGRKADWETEVAHQVFPVASDLLIAPQNEKNIIMLTEEEKYEIKDRVNPYVRRAYAIEYDRKHKIYIIMDADTLESRRKSAKNKKRTIIPVDRQMPPQKATVKIIEWYEKSDDLRFIRSIDIEGFEDIVNMQESLVEETPYTSDDLEDDDMVSWRDFDPDAVGIIGFEDGEPVWGWGNGD